MLDLFVYGLFKQLQVYLPDRITDGRRDRRTARILSALLAHDNVAFAAEFTVPDAMHGARWSRDTIDITIPTAPDCLKWERMPANERPRTGVVVWHWWLTSGWPSHADHGLPNAPIRISEKTVRDIVTELNAEFSPKSADPPDF